MRHIAGPFSTKCSVLAGTTVPRLPSALNLYGSLTLDELPVIVQHRAGHNRRQRGAGKQEAGKGSGVSAV
jgi:hypothetical protein